MPEPFPVTTINQASFTYFNGNIGKAIFIKSFPRIIHLFRKRTEIPRCRYVCRTCSQCNASQNIICSLKFSPFPLHMRKMNGCNVIDGYGKEIQTGSACSACIILTTPAMFKEDFRIPVHITPHHGMRSYRAAMLAEYGFKGVYTPVI